MVNPRDIAGNAEEEEMSGLNNLGQRVSPKGFQSWQKGDSKMIVPHNFDYRHNMEASPVAPSFRG